MVYGGPAHIKLVCEWESDIKAHVFGAIPDLIPEPHESVMELRQYYNHPLQTSLTESLKIYTREETVSYPSITTPHILICIHTYVNFSKRTSFLHIIT